MPLKPFQSKTKPVTGTASGVDMFSIPCPSAQGTKTRKHPPPFFFNNTHIVFLPGFSFGPHARDVDKIFEELL